MDESSDRNPHNLQNHRNDESHSMIFRKHHIRGNQSAFSCWRRFLAAASAMLVISACSTDKGVGGTIVLSSSADADILFPPLTLTLQGRQGPDQIFANLAAIGPSPHADAKDGCA